MDTDRDLISKNRYGIFSIWLNWTMSAGTVMVALSMTQAVSKTVYPLVCLILALGLYIGVRFNRASRQPVCFVMPFLMSKSMLWSAIVMIGINMIHRHGVIDLLVADVELLNPEIPYIAILIIAPITALITGWALHLRERSAFCAECQRHNGTPAERGYLGEFYSREGSYQGTLMFWLMVVCGLIAWGYYFFFYVNVNINSPDLFVFVVAPCIVFGLSIVYVTIRYIGVWHFYVQHFGNDSSNMGRTTRIRFLIISGEEMLLTLPEVGSEADLSDMRIDTPATLTVRRKDNVTLPEAENYFKGITGIENADIRFLYSNTAESADFSIYHFLVKMPSKELPEGARIKGEWFTLNEVAEMLNAQALRPILSAEIVRLHAITMAWKSYDETGRRRYKIKHYQPCFRLSDISESDVDYNDPKWLYVSNNNEDSRFFKLRRLWSKYVSGSAH